MVLGKLGDSYVLSSESCGLDIIGAQLIRDVEPGEILIIQNNEIKSIKPFKKTELRPCLFEYIYFSRPDSIFEGKMFMMLEKKLVINLQMKICQIRNLLMLLFLFPTLETHQPWFCRKNKKKFEFGIIRNHYTGRTFIQDSNSIRHFSRQIKA